MTQSNQQASVTVARLIAFSILASTLVFWAIVWFISEGGAKTGTTATVSQNAVLGIWGVLALAGFAGALFMQRQAVSIGDEARSRGETPASKAGIIQARLIVAWALLEGVAVLAGIALWLWGYRMPILVCIPVLFIGMALSFPRPEWFGE